MSAPGSEPEVDLSDLPDGLPPEVIEELRAARLKRIETEGRRLSAEAELRRQRSLGARYKAWALDDTIGQELQRSLVVRGTS